MKVVFANGTAAEFAEYPLDVDRLTLHTKDSAFTFIHNKMDNTDFFRKAVESLEMKERLTVNDGTEYVLVMDDLVLRIGKNYDYIRVTSKFEDDMFMASISDFTTIESSIKSLNRLAYLINIHCFEYLKNY
tara:strand:+ start:10080 stop:10472 length:393 start_codon:yes stop_codon:yes gene_type:complete